MEYTEEIITTANARIRLFRPVLTPEERERRLNEIKKSAANLIVVTMCAKKEVSES